MKVYAVLTEDGLDQLCHGKVDADREKRDLAKMGFQVRVREFQSEAEAYAWCEAKGINT